MYLWRTREMLSVPFATRPRLKGMRGEWVVCRYALTPEEIRVYCNQFIKDHGHKIQIAVLGKQMRRYPETIDDNVCNSLKVCPKGWISPEDLKEGDVSDLEMEL